MITAYTSYEPTPGDEVADAFYWGRLGMIERRARLRGLDARREKDHDKDGDYVEYLNIDVKLDFENNGHPDVEDLTDRFTTFLYEIEDSDFGHLLFEVDTARERHFLAALELAFVSIEDRQEDPEGPAGDPPRREIRAVRAADGTPVTETTLLADILHEAGLKPREIFPSHNEQGLFFAHLTEEEAERATQQELRLLAGAVSYVVEISP